MTLHAPPKKKKQKADGPRRAWPLRALWFAFKWGLVLSIWGALGILGVAAWYARELPAITKSPQIERKPSITVLANDGSVIARYGDIKGDALTVADMPPHLIHAVLATEDRRFYHHFGLDPIGVARAVVVNVTRKGVVQGGSTITQQLAKNLFLTRERTLKRKIQEALLALWLERELTKDEILAAYLNRVYMGAGAYGVDAASEVYFKKSARDLNLREAAILAGLLKAPSRYSPRSNPREAEARSRVVIDNMKEAGYLTEKEQTRLTGAPVPRRKPAENDSDQYFGDYIVEQLDDLVGAQTQDLIVKTTMDPDIQRGATDAITRALNESGIDRRASQAAVVVMRRDGAVLALVGGRDYNRSQFNRATHALRPPGSSFKPIVYLAALEAGFTPDSLVMDEPILEGDYRPTNFDDKYYGEIPLSTALAFSLNTVAVRLMAQLGPDAIVQTARRLGITTELIPNYATALGANGAYQLEMTGAYAVLANGGLGVTPYGILQVATGDGQVLYEQSPITSLPRVASARAVSELTGMMEGVLEYGTGQGARLGGFAAGKTGTSQDYRDAWFSGFTQKYVATVWVGNDDNSSMRRVTGGSLPAQIWRGTMVSALNDATPAPDDMPAADEGMFEGLLDRVLGGPRIEWNDQTLGGSGDGTGGGGTPGTAYENMPRRFND